jgi:hypothetical protein
MFLIVDLISLYHPFSKSQLNNWAKCIPSPFTLFLIRTNKDSRSERQNNLSERSELLF